MNPSCAALDQQIEVAREHLYALYKKRRELRAAARPKRKQLTERETFNRAVAGQSLADIATAFGVSLPTVKDRLLYGIHSRAYISHGGDWKNTWRDQYRECIWLNNILPAATRLKQRRFWPWSAAVHDGISWNDPCWSKQKEVAGVV